MSDLGLQAEDILAVATLSVLCCIVGLNVRKSIQPTVRQLRTHVARHLLLATVPWQAHRRYQVRRVTLLMLAIAVTANVLVVCFPWTNAQRAGRTAGRVAIVDMALLYLSPSLSSSATLLGISMANMRSVHAAAIWPMLLILVVHVVIMRPAQPLFVYPFSQSLYGVIVG